MTAHLIIVQFIFMIAAIHFLNNWRKIPDV